MRLFSWIARRRADVPVAVEGKAEECLLISGNASDQKFSNKALARTVKECGQLDVLVNNPAFQVHTSRFEKLTAEHFDETSYITGEILPIIGGYRGR